MQRVFTLERLVFVSVIAYLLIAHSRREVIVVEMVVESTTPLKEQLVNDDIETSYQNETFKKALDITYEVDAKAALARVADQISPVKSYREKDFNRCKLIDVGRGYGMHKICGDLLEVRSDLGCAVLSYGIENDYTFDLEIQKKTGCRVFGIDPTVTHPSSLGPNVYFLQFAAPGIRNDAAWATLSPSKLARLVAGSDPIPVLKMDCEGCEYRLFEDVVANDPTFFKRVKQFAVEIHVSRYWMRTRDDLVKLGKLYALLFASGHDLMHVYITRCGYEQERYGCLPAAAELGYGSTCVVWKMCQNLLFAKLY
jgi:hypothetical protein